MCPFDTRESRVIGKWLGKKAASKSIQTTKSNSLVADDFKTRLLLECQRKRKPFTFAR